jgi:acyl-CoA thioesterase II
VGDLGEQTAVTPVGDAVTDDDVHQFTALVHPDWEIWGPEGGYVAAIALRAAGAVSPFDRPASFFCHYLSVAAFEPVDLEVTTLRSGRTVLSQQVHMSQHGRPVLQAMVWSVGQVEGLLHEDVHPPDAPDPDDLKSPQELWPDRERPPFSFWDNFDQRPVDPHDEWPPKEALEPTWRNWVRCRPSPDVADPWIDAARTLVVLDVMSWPAGHRPHAHRPHSFIAPSLDLYVSFQHSGGQDEWLLLDGHAPVSADGLLSWNGRVWSRDRRLIASGGGQAVYRHT